MLKTESVDTRYKPAKHMKEIMLDAWTGVREVHVRRFYI